MKALFVLIGLASLLVACESGGASRRELVDGRGDKYRLAIPAKQISGPVSIGPLYNSVPKNPKLFFQPDLQFLNGKTNVPTMIPVLRKP